MGEILADLAAQQSELDGLLAGLDDASWALPSPCEGWSVADVVLHLAQTNEMGTASATGRFLEHLEGLIHVRGGAGDVDAGAELMVRAERGAPNAELLARWRETVRDLTAALAAADPHARVDWVAGQLSVRTLTTTRLAEAWIHTGDVADALGVEVAPAARLEHVARLAWRTLPYAFARAGRELTGPVTFDLAGPDGAAWHYASPDAVTVVSGPGVELCLVAARRVEPGATDLVATGPDGAAVLELVRTYA
jgi:uncharacterized protein (TIGR03084 family)